MNETKGTGIVGIITILLLLAAWLTRPLWHTILFNDLYLNFPFWIAFIFLLILFRVPVKSSTGIIMRGIAVFILGVFALSIVLVGGAWSGHALVSGIEPGEIKSLHETTGIRYIPLEVAHANTKTTMNDPLYVPGETHPFDFGGDLSYITPRTPNGFMNYWQKQSNGAVIVFANGTQKTIEQPFKYGEGMIFTDNIWWQLISHNYWCDIDQVYYVFDDSTGELLAMAPYITYYFNFPVFVPEWGGVMVVHGNGRIEDLSPEEAITDSRFANQRLYPESLARTIGKAWQYKNGIINAMFYHIDQPELADSGNTGNQMPYLLPTEKGFVWFNGFKPNGESQSLYKIMFIDAHNGSIDMYNVPESINLAGPQKSIGFVESSKALASFDWSKMKAIEPRPIVHNGELYWQISVTNNDYSTVTLTVMVNSVVNSADGDQQTIIFGSKSEMDSFLAGKPTQASTAAPQISGLQAATKTVAPILDFANMTKNELLSIASQALDELQNRPL